MPKYFEKAATNNDVKGKERYITIYQKNQRYIIIIFLISEKRRIKEKEKKTSLDSLKPAIDYFRQMVASQSLVDTILPQHSINQPATIIQLYTFTKENRNNVSNYNLISVLSFVTLASYFWFSIISGAM